MGKNAKNQDDKYMKNNKLNNNSNKKEDLTDEPIRIAQIMGKWLGGGVESVVMNYYRHMDRTKIQFDFICDEDSKNIPYEEIEKMGGKVILIPPYQKVIKYHKELKKILKNGNYKIVHSHINTLSVFSLFAAKCAGVPVRIAHSHSTTNKKEFKKNIMKQILRPFSKLFATDYMCCSELAGRWLFGNKEYDKGKVYLLNNAIDVDKFKFDENIRNAKRQELNIDDNTLVIGHVGRFVEQKNHRFLIDVFNEVHKQKSNSVLLLVGQGPLMHEIKEKVKKLGLENYVLFLGQRNDTNELYQAMDLFVLPSLYEGLPVVGIEAQASGLLCLFSDKMTKETKATQNAEFINLDESNVDIWTKQILDGFEIYKRKNVNEEIKSAGFDIKEQAKNLEKYYLKKTSKTIIHIINSKIFSGLESVVCDIITSDLKEKYKFIYVTQNGPIVDTLKERKVNYEIIDKMSCKEIKRVIKKYKPIIIHAHDFTASVICSAVKKNVPLIEHIHNNCPWLKKVCINSIAFLYAGIKADKILTVSESIENEYIFSNFIKRKIECIGNPLSRKKILNNVTERDYEKKYDICCCARLTEPKDPFRFIEIIEKIKLTIPNIKAVWVGDGELKEKMIKTIKEKGLESNLELVGCQKNPYKYIAQSRIFVLTSAWEGFGLVAFEALTLGLPCVVSNVGGLVDIVDGTCGKLCKKNEDFENETIKLLSDEKYYEETKDFSIKKSKKIENIETYIEDVSIIYDFLNRRKI